MIEQREIFEHNESLGVPPTTIDKDWILGHFLNAMFQFEDIKHNFVFKGGTCLKKGYFPDYRFSEDLDFTLLDNQFLVDKKLINKLIKLTTQNSAAKFYCESIKEQIYKDIKQGYEVIIKFWGANHKPNQRPLPPKRWQTKIKLDINFTEKLLCVPLLKKIIHPLF